MTDAWQPPTYRELHIRPGYIDNECDRCGSLVTDIIQHNRFHHRLDTLNGGVVGLTKLIIPSLPDGALLTAQQSEILSRPTATGGDSNVTSCVQ